MTFEERCRLSEQCLPEAPYREMLTKLHDEMLEALAQPQQEPLEYWNAVEGWVKLEEAREHLDSVGCGTIYKTSGEGRVPLCIAQPQQEPDDLTVWRSRALQAEAVIDKFMAQPKQEPVYKYCDDGKVIFTNPEILSRRPNKEKT